MEAACSDNTSTCKMYNIPHPHQFVMENGTKFSLDTLSIKVLVIAWARVPHVGYWHVSGLEPEGHRPDGSKPPPCQ